MGSFYPWSVLGLSPEAQESDIKKAYARLLRQTRPDEDPEGFQALVQARDAAMAYARRAAAQRRQAAGLDESAHDRPAEARVEPAARVPDHAEPPPPPPTRQVDGKPQLPTEDGSNVVPFPQATSADSPERKPDGDRVAEPPRDAAHAPEPSVRRPVPPAEAPAAPPVPELNARHAADAIMAGLTLDADEARLGDAAKAAARLHEFSLGERRQAEPQLLEAVLPRLRDISLRLMMGRPGLFGRFASMFRKADPKADARAKRQLALILLLNEEFGWTASDRRVYELAGREKGSAAVLYLNAFERAAKVARAAASNTPNAVPLLEERDARAAFGAEYGFYAQLLGNIRTGTRLPVRWNTGIFLLLPLWLISRDLYRVLLLWISAVLTGVGYAQLDVPYANESALVRFAGWLPLLALHLFAGAYAYQWIAGRAISRIARADRRGLFDPDKRAAFLSRQSRTVIRTWPSGRNWIWWALAWALFWLVKGLIVASQH